MSGTDTPAIQAKVTITTVSIKGDSVAMTFNKVIELSFNYFKGTVKVIDSEQGEFIFGLTLVTVTTITIAGTNSAIVIS